MKKSLSFSFTLGPAYSEWKDDDEADRCNRLLVVSEIFNIIVIGFGAKKSPRYSWMFVLNEFVVNGTQCI